MRFSKLRVNYNIVDDQMKNQLSLFIEYILVEFRSRKQIPHPKAYTEDNYSTFVNSSHTRRMIMKK